MDGIELKTVLVGVVRAWEQWHTNLSRVVVTTLSCVDSISNLGVVCVDYFPAVGLAIANVATPTAPGSCVSFTCSCCRM